MFEMQLLNNISYVLELDHPNCICSFMYICIVTVLIEAMQFLFDFLLMLDTS